jgi:hypothetical protein
MDVCLNDSHRTKVRLLAVPVNEEIANQRRMKAKKEMRGHNPAADLLNLMAWSIFITTIPKEQADFKRILIIYGLRWRIEIIFKGWKSHLQFAKLHNVSENQLRVILTARFIMIVICMQNIYNPCYNRIFSKYKRHLSMLKILNYLMKNPEKILQILRSNTSENYQMAASIDDALVKYCTYDRRVRPNFSQILIATAA